MGAFTAKQEGWYFDPAAGEIIDPAHDEEDMSGVVARIEVYQADNANDRSDGYLLAAAPDLLGACIMALQVMGVPSQRQMLKETLQAAVAKARPTAAKEG